MSRPPIRLMVVIGSVRPGRLGLAVALWVHESVAKFGGFDVDFVDLAELDLPFMNEPKHPKHREYRHKHTIAWGERVDAADAFLFVAPEYNHSYSPALKNALDYLHHEWQGKPVGLVSYGDLAGGTRGVTALRPVLSALAMVGTESNVEIPYVARQIDDGFFEPTDRQADKLTLMLDELGRLSPALRSVRGATLLTA
ncbi:NADPH-dependent FMN reductase [Mycetocola zhujimingii]|uniref:NADPH-dependent FMN reductase n=1 Tax=Mycetocola zhujimingii TaxID=2079792 RepID=UPI0018E09F00|nr:NAD(P)H-dependent oxidoreductase [Mycetocola zhujimingii]